MEESSNSEAHTPISVKELSVLGQNDRYPTDAACERWLFTLLLFVIVIRIVAGDLLLRVG